jgi:uncharacterized membrane protein YdjX (TVP38/TMEM64 family)
LFGLIFSYSYFSKGVVYSVSNSDEDAVVQFVDSFGVFSYLIFVLLVILEVVLAPIPALVLYVAGGALFGTFLGGTLTLVGNLIGALLAFWIARKLGRNFVEKRVDSVARKKFDNFAEKYGGFSLFILRINPLTTSDIFSYISGLSKMKVKTFILGTGLGLAPMIFVQAYFGEAFVNSHPILYAVLVWISIVYLLVFVYLIWRTLSLKKKIIVEEPVKEKS